MSNWNDIGDLLKKGMEPELGDKPVIPWDSIGKKVARANFFKFTLSNFNVYYVVVAAMLISSLSYASYKAISFRHELKQKNEVIEQLKKKIERIEIENLSLQVPEKKEDEKIISTTKDTFAVNSRKPVLKKDTVIVIPAPVKTDTQTQVNVVKKVVKKQVVIKKPRQIRDTLIIR